MQNLSLCAQKNLKMLYYSSTFVFQSGVPHTHLTSRNWISCKTKLSNLSAEGLL